MGSLREKQGGENILLERDIQYKVHNEIRVNTNFQGIYESFATILYIYNIHNMQ